MRLHIMVSDFVSKQMHWECLKNTVRLIDLKERLGFVEMEQKKVNKQDLLFSLFPFKRKRRFSQLVLLDRKMGFDSVIEYASKLSKYGQVYIYSHACLS